MQVNMHRIMNDFAEIIKHNRTPQRGYTRFSYSLEDNEARNYLLSQMNGLGLSIKVDAIGNIRAKYGEMEAPSIMIGSHIDTVENGGQFDGLTGVLAGLEIIRLLKEKKISLKYPIELIIFAEEEGSNFGIPMLGSKVLTGRYGLEELKTIVNDKGISIFETVKNFGLNIENLQEDLLRKDEVHAMIELHIEQGAVLESQKKSLGIVQAIAGMKSYKVILEGDSNHAGTTPMELRRDPMAGAAIIIAHIQKAAQKLALPTTVATVGKINCEPNMHNVIPQKVEFFIDIRDVEAQGIELISAHILKKIIDVSNEQKLENHIELVGDSTGVKLSSRVIKTMEENAALKNLSYLKMDSGAVHDAAMLTDLTEVGMIFVPSHQGKSHSPVEYTSERDIEAGSNFLLDVVLDLAAKEVKEYKILK